MELHNACQVSAAGSGAFERSLRALALVSAMGAAAAAHAHHSAAQFDTTAQVSIEGTVSKYAWRNPHVYMALQVRGADGAVVEQEIEAGASSVLLPLGLTPDSVAVGERVTIKGNPSRRGPGHMVLGRELVKADGTVLPLNIGSTSRRAAPTNVSASSIEGTWFSPLAGFRGFRDFNGQTKWQLTEKGRAAIAQFDSRDTAHADCIPVTPPSLMLYPVATTVDVQEDKVVFRVDWMKSERIAYLDGRIHPQDAERTLHGHSIGHWEGATLVVDTMQFADHREGNAMGGLASGAGKHLIERFSLADDHRHLRYEITLEDPEYLAAPVMHVAELEYRPDLVPTGLACDLEVAQRFLQD